jgi:prophage maintenance system killer protein
VTTALQAADIRFVNEVAARRFAPGGQAAVDDGVVAGALAAAGEGTVFVRAATLAAVLLQRGAFVTAPLQTTLLVLHCALSLEGFTLVAPQGVVAGMVRGLAAGEDAGGVARWLEDRAVSTASG